MQYKSEFQFSHLYFNILTGSVFIGILFDHETVRPSPPSLGVINSYEEIEAETSYLLAKWLDPNAPLHEAYPIPIKDINGKK